MTMQNNNFKIKQKVQNNNNSITNYFFNNQRLIESSSNITYIQKTKYKHSAHQLFKLRVFSKDRSLYLT